MTTEGQNQTALRIGYPGHWVSLVPALQHNAYADLILGHQFETLIETGGDGKVYPQAARSWEIDPDMKVFTFRIDTDRCFSDGTPLEAGHFKESWEYGLSLRPKSAKSSLQDVLYKVEGFEDFAETGSLQGLVVLDRETFQIRFRTPFRMGLENLMGTRLAVFKRQGTEYIGTGKFIIRELDENALQLLKNRHAQSTTSFDEIYISYHRPEVIKKELEIGNINVIQRAGKGIVSVREISEAVEISSLGAFETAHMVLSVNGAGDHLFSNPGLRQAFQYLIYKGLSGEETSADIFSNFSLRVDPQIYLPARAGHLDETTVRDLIGRGKSHVADLVAATRKNPVKFVHRWGFDGLASLIKKILKENGVGFEITEAQSMKEFADYYYKNTVPDLVLASLNVAGGDPDGIYHALGRDGAISSPKHLRDTVQDLLEAGRSIVDQRLIHEHYQKVSWAVLEEVPFVHLGFSIEFIAYRNDQLQPKHEESYARERAVAVNYLEPRL